MPILLILLLALIFVIGCIVYAFIHLTKKGALKGLFKDFKRKLYMTISLGAIFLIFYLLFMGLSTYLVKYSEADLFFLLYSHPIEAIYGGLCLFACFSLLIYLARMLVKYFYLTRGKDF